MQARQHRARFIRFILDEVTQDPEVLVGVGVNEWIDEELAWSIEDALDGRERSSQGGWLVGIRRARDSLEYSISDDGGNDSNDEKVMKIHQLRELAAHQLPPTPLPTSKHLLLSFAPVGSRVTFPEEDTGFDIIPSQI
ncbi:hypothetical protein E1B28_000156 [Marasmius oreades]|uniref:Uncharacterized protein n=1 Tax=Marasmius oreades TaxID=181124 RepID=A0A9P8AE67_9AGAR|nr:uncharacterized protein E1B28_000156 [Marasmius oreades]KAG7098188.1 hypothetical protein E1B28_000156 [Marasmius oreades]